MSKEPNTRRAIAEEAAQILHQMFLVRLPDGFSANFSLLDVCGIGASLLLAGKVFLSPNRKAFLVDPSLLSIIYHVGNDLKELADCIEIYISKNLVDADQLLRNLREMQVGLGDPKQMRDMMRRVGDEFSPPGKPGRPTKIRREDWPRFLERSSSLLPLCDALLSMQEIVPQRTIEENLLYLSSDYPHQIEYLSRYSVRLVESSGLKFAATLAKTPATQRRKLCDIWAGFEFTLTDKTALEVAKQARAAHGKQVRLGNRV